MADNEEWAERRRRMVKCKKHGLHFDPKMASGCTLCLKESTKAPPQRPPQVTIILLCILGMAFAAYQIFGPKQVDEEDSYLGPPDVAEAPSRLDAEPYRQPIQALERALFADVADEFDLSSAGASIANSARSLGAEIRRLGPEAAAESAAAVAGLGEKVGDTFSFRDLEQVKGDWLQIREHLFTPASWFARPSRGGSRDQRVAFAEFSALADNLQSLLEEGAAEAQSYVDSADFPDRDQRWEEFQADWRQRISELWRNQPARPGADADPGLLLAAQRLGTAFESARSLASGSSYLSSGNPALLFDPALKQVEQARQSLEEARP